MSEKGQGKSRETGWFGRWAGAAVGIMVLAAAAWWLPDRASEDPKDTSAKRGPLVCAGDGADRYCVQARLVTVGEHRECLGTGACDAMAGEHLTAQRRCRGARPEMMDRPVNCLSAAAAAEYCRWLGMELPAAASLIAHAEALAPSNADGVVIFQWTGTPSSETSRDTDRGRVTVGVWPNTKTVPVHSTDERARMLPWLGFRCALGGSGT